MIFPRVSPEAAVLLRSTAESTEWRRQRRLIIIRAQIVYTEAWWLEPTFIIIMLRDIIINIMLRDIMIMIGLRNRLLNLSEGMLPSNNYKNLFYEKKHFFLSFLDKYKSNVKMW